MSRARIAILLLVGTLVFLLYQTDQQAKVIQKQKQEMRMLLQELLKRGGNHV